MYEFNLNQPPIFKAVVPADGSKKTIPLDPVDTQTMFEKKSSDALSERITALLGDTCLLDFEKSIYWAVRVTKRWRSLKKWLSTKI